MFPIWRGHRLCSACFQWENKHWERNGICRQREWMTQPNQSGSKGSTCSGCCLLDPIEKNVPPLFFFCSKLLLTHVCAKHIFNLHHDRQYQDQGRLRGLNDFKLVGFYWEVAAASVGLSAALRPVLLSLMNCFLLTSNGSPWPVVPLHLDLGPVIQRFRTMMAACWRWALVGWTREDSGILPTEETIYLSMRSGRVLNNQRTPTKITAVKQHFCQQPAMWLSSYIPNKTDGVKCTKTIECGFGFPGTLNWEETVL